MAVIIAARNGLMEATVQPVKDTPGHFVVGSSIPLSGFEASDYDIKIKNNSTSYPTSDINLSFEALTGTSNTWYTIKPSGGAFSTTWSTPALAPGALSTLLTVRLTVSDNQILGPQAARIRASSVWGIAGGTSAGTGSATATLTLI